jgi:hypothetical protein
VEPFFHSVNEAEAALFVVLVRIVGLGVVLQIEVVFWWMVVVLLGDAQHHLVLYLYVRIIFSRTSIRARPLRFALFIEAAIAVGAIAVGGQRLRRTVSSLATRHAESIG